MRAVSATWLRRLLLAVLLGIVTTLVVIIACAWITPTWNQRSTVAPDGEVTVHSSAGQTRLFISHLPDAFRAKESLRDSPDKQQSDLMPQFRRNPDLLELRSLGWPFRCVQCRITRTRSPGQGVFQLWGPARGIQWINMTSQTSQTEFAYKATPNDGEPFTSFVVDTPTMKGTMNLSHGPTLGVLASIEHGMATDWSPLPASDKRLRVLPYYPIWTGLAGNVGVCSSLWLMLFVASRRLRGYIRRRRGLCPQCCYQIANSGLEGCAECGWNRDGVQ